MIPMTAVAKTARREGRFFAIAGIVTLVVGLVFALGTQIEAKLWPVSGGAKVQQVFYNDDGSVSFKFSFFRYRPSCEWLSVDWYILEDGAKAPIDSFQLSHTPALRPYGLNHSAWYKLPGPGEYYTNTLYNCHMPWVSYVEFGPLHIPPP